MLWWVPHSKRCFRGESPGSPVVRTLLSLLRAKAQSLVGKLRSCKLCGTAKRNTDTQTHTDTHTYMGTFGPFFNKEGLSLNSSQNYFSSLWIIRGFPDGSDGKESAYNSGDLGLIPGLGRSPGEGMATHSSILAWRIPWTEELGGLQPTGSLRVGHVLATNTWITRFQTPT